MQIKLTNAFFLVRKRPLIIMMRTFIFLCWATVFSLTPKHALSQNEKIRIDTDKEATVDEVFDMIIAQTDYSFVYRVDLFKNVSKVQLKKGVIRLDKLLSQSLSTIDLNVIVTKNNTILIKEKSSNDVLLQQQVSGTVTDESGQPIPGVTVLIKGTTKGTATNIDGHYSINVPHPEQVLVFSSLGFKPQEITVNNQTTINVSLKESISALDEVVINAGYYNTTQREQTGSISRIDAKAIEKQPVENPLAAMQGYLPGVNITQDSGVPGGSFKIEVRGTNSLSSRIGANEPLYIIDGVPYSNESLIDPFLPGTIAVGGNNSVFVSPLNVIDPSSIQSIEVLKDADATAIYGARGANGVVLITTKKGNVGKTQIKFNMTTSLGDVPHFKELLSTEQYLEMRWEGLANDGYTSETVSQNFKDANPDLFLWDQERYTDWQEVFFGGTAYRNTANLSFSGGSENTQFLFSGGYLSETAVTPGDSKYTKATMHTSINHQSANQRFKVNVAIDYGMDDNNQPSGFSVAQEVAIRLPPNAPATHDEEGNISWEGWSFEKRNPMAQLSNRYLVETKNLLLNSVIAYTPITDLEFKTTLGYTDYRSEGYRTYSYVSVWPPSSEPTSASTQVNFNEASRQSWIVEPQVNWHKAWGKATVKVLLGSTFQGQESKQFSVFAQGFDNEDQIYNLALANFSAIQAQREKEYYYQSFFGRLNFNWDGRYFINLTGRRDGSSRFAPGRQFGNFGAVGVSWIFSEMAFFKESSFLSFGKLRSSYGITGSDNIGDYQFYDAYQNSQINYDGPTWEPGGLYNPIFQWETNIKFEAALELGFLKDRIFLTTAWYQNRSSNQLTGIPLPGTTGFSNITGNFDATVENSGLEMDFRSINIQNKSFNWTTTFNITANRNKLVKFDGLENSTFRDNFVVGQPLSIKKFYNMIGVDPETGLYRYEDYNGDGRISSPEDRQYIFNTAPKFYGGLGNTLRYKNLTLDVFFQFKKHKMTDFVVMPGGPFNQPVSVLDRWQQVGDQAPIQRFSAGLGTAGLEAFSAFSDGGDRYILSSANVKDASFIRLRNVSLSYALPKETIPGMDVNLYLQGQNLLTFTKFKGFDPDGNFTRQPLLRKITMGIQLGF